MADDTTQQMAREDGTWIDEDGVQHGIDDSTTGDAEKGATLGGIGGAITGLAAGAAAGPLGAVAGAIIGGVAGAVASGAAVAAVDRVDNDNTVSGVGSGATYEDTYRDDLDDNMDDMIYPSDRNWTTANANDPAYRNTYATGAYANDPDGNVGMNRREELGESMPSIKTGGYANDGTPDTRGVAEKAADAITGDVVDDKTGKVVKHP